MGVEAQTMSSETLPQLLEAIDRRREEWERLKPISQARLDNIDRKIRLEWNYNSNAIEGNRISLGETRALLTQNITPGGKRFEEVRDIQGHNRAITCVYDWIQRKMKLTETAIRDLHKVLMVEEHEIEAQTETGEKTRKRIRPGHYKDEPNFVTVGGKKVLYALPQDVPAQMHELLTWYRDRASGAELHPILVASIFHHRFTRIHPFDDGNGRLGRLLLNFILMERGYAPVILTVSEREIYISALRAADADDSALMQINRFIAEAELASLDIYCRGARGENVEEITDLDKAVLMMKQQLSRAEEPLPNTKQTVAACFEHSIVPLVTRTTQKLTEFDEFFSRAQIDVNAGGGNVTCKAAGVVPYIKQWISERPIQSIQVTFRWYGFKRGGLKVFDHHAVLTVNLEPLKWSVSPGNHVRMYQHQLGEDAIRETVDALRRRVLNQIETVLNQA
jgi:Fic family protein